MGNISYGVINHYFGNHCDNVIQITYHALKRVIIGGSFFFMTAIPVDTETADG